MIRKTRFIALGFAATIAGTGLRALAGDLNPPVGLVASTHKTLTEVEPRIAINSTNTPGDADSLFKITQPGSYYLTGNIPGVNSKRAIEIAANNVTLDLMGFALMGVAGSLDGIATSVTAGNLTIRNGTVSAFGQDGVDLRQNGSASGLGVLVEQMHASGNGGIGISANSNAVVRACTASTNGGGGILTNANAVIEACSTRENGGAGITTLSGSTVIGCSARANVGEGIVTTSGCTISACSAHLNNLDGIKVSSDCTVRGNTCFSNNPAAGIHATQSGNRIEDNNCTTNTRGIDVDLPGNFISRNTCSGNTTNNWDVAAGNVCLVIQGVSGAAILGNTGGVAPGSTDPNANYTY